jgi:hypothetical protein
MKRNNIEQNAAAIKRWQSRLKRAVTMLGKLEKQRTRLLRAKPVSVTPRVTLKAPVEIAPPVATPAPLTAMPDTGIPGFLQRKKLDPVAEQIAQEQKEIKRRKSAGRIATMKAKRAGDLSKMPLTGKAALAAIRG